MTPLITADEHMRLRTNGQERAAGQETDPLPVVRLFTPDAHATWPLASPNPADGDTAHCLIDLGIGLPALRTVKLSDLATIVGPRRRQRLDNRLSNHHQVGRTVSILVWSVTRSV